MTKQDDSEESGADRMQIIDSASQAVHDMFPASDELARDMLSRYFAEPALGKIVSAVRPFRDRRDGIKAAVWKCLDYACQQLDGEHAQHMQDTDKFLMQLHNLFAEHSRETMEIALWIFAKTAPDLNEFYVATKTEEYASHFANCVLQAIKPPYRVKTREELAEEDTNPGKKIPKPH